MIEVGVVFLLLFIFIVENVEQGNFVVSLQFSPYILYFYPRLILFVFFFNGGPSWKAPLGEEASSQNILFIIIIIIIGSESDLRSYEVT